MAKVVGIDLGTTNSCVAFIDGKRSVVVPNREGGRTTPSVVGFTASGERLVGLLAKRQLLTNPEHSVFAVKRLIGRKLSDAAIAPQLKWSPNSLVAADNGDLRLELRGRRFSPPEISAIILGELKQMAEDYLGEAVTQAVITVPAYFDDAQRQATKDAGKIAALDVIRIINEPTAAALAFGIELDNRDQKLAVYDLGGGTFDISILALHQGSFEVLSTHGDSFLGGEDFDQSIVEWLAAGFLEAEQVDLRQDKMALQRLKEAAEKAKLELSSATESEINLPFIAARDGAPLHLITQLTRAEFERRVEPLIAKTLECCAVALAEAGIKKEGIDQVLLVGGQTRMPKVQAAVEQFFKRRPNKRVDPDEVVAVGAALQAALLQGELPKVELHDVLSLSLGVATAGGVMTTMIAKNSKLPCEHAEVFSTAVDNQAFVEVQVLQGERSLAENNRLLGTFQLLGIPKAARGVPQIEVRFVVGADGILQVTARDLGTKKEQTMRVVPTSGLSASEVADLVAEAAAHKEEDARRRQLAERKVELESQVVTTERSLAEFTPLLSTAQIAAVNVAIANAKSNLLSCDLASVTTALREIELAAQQIGAAIYAQAIPPSAHGQGGQGSK